MNENRDYRVTMIFIWLILLTMFYMYDKISIGQRVGNIILPPPILEPIEVDVEMGGLYE